MKKLTAGIFATILGLTAIDAYAAVPSQNYVDTVVAGAKTFATSEADQALADAKTWVDEQGYLTEHQDITGKADTTYVNAELAKKQNTLDTTNVIVDPTKSGGNVVTKITANNGVVTYETGTVATTAGLAELQQTVNGHTTDISNLETAVADKQKTLTADQLNAVNSGITADLVTTYNGYATTIAGAVSDAAKAKSDAASAVTDAASAQSTANGAVTTANEAKTAAGEAQTTANNAVTTAEGAVTTANEAKSTADAAKTAANTATTNVTNLTTTVSGHTTSIGNLQSGKLNVVPADSVTTDGQYVLTMKKVGETMEYGWELITRSEGQ